jgi:colanic acid biosynthesis glycosyl transferase WcaI
MDQSVQMSGPELLVITQVYNPEPNFITADVAQHLSRRLPVTVLTAHPNYPFGRFYRGVRPWRLTRTVENGVTVWRLPFFADHSMSLLRRALSYSTFALAATIVAPFVGRRAGVVWVYHGPFTTGLAALWFRLRRNVRVVFTCADVWPDSFVAAGVRTSSVLMRAARLYNRLLNRAAHVIVCATRGTMKRLHLDGIAAERLVYVPVWITGASALTPEADAAGGEPARIVYAGNLGPAQRVETLVRAAGLVALERPDVIFEIYGSGAVEGGLRRLAADIGVPNVVFHGRVPPEVAFQAVVTATAQVVALQRSPLFSCTVPSKLYGSFAAGTPVLYGLHGEAAALAEASGGGIAFDPEDPSSLAAAVMELLSLPAERRAAMRASLRDFASHFRSDFLLQEYEAILCPDGALDEGGGVRARVRLAVAAAHARVATPPAGEPLR